jgi:hypothetical protein
MASLMCPPLPCVCAGLSYNAEGKELTLRLLRPTLILASLATYRFFFCMGTLHRQLQHERLDEHALEERRYVVWVHEERVVVLS